MTGERSLDPARETSREEEWTGRSRLEAIVRGAVQGVGFRVFVTRHARAMGLDGWVANRADGTVEVVAEGPPDDIDRLIGHLREGPPAAHVRSVDLRIERARGLAPGFLPRSGQHRGD